MLIKKTHFLASRLLHLTTRMWGHGHGIWAQEQATEAPVGSKQIEAFLACFTVWLFGNSKVIQNPTAN